MQSMNLAGRGIDFLTSGHNLAVGFSDSPVRRHLKPSGCTPRISHEPSYAKSGRRPSVLRSLVHRRGAGSQVRACADDSSSRELSSLGLEQVLPLLRQRWEKQRQAGDKARGSNLGSVYLVGTGPGDPELLTLKALRLMQTADLVLYDRLVSLDILELVNPNALLLYVGKRAGLHSRSQEEIHELLLGFATAGATVIRLKGGDPLVFGRGGEELDYLVSHGIPVQTVPGITAASGVAAQLGIPLTHRGLATSVRFVTGHAQSCNEDKENCLASFHPEGDVADPLATLVIYMGLATLPQLIPLLLRHGLPDSTPACAVERGTTKEQRVVWKELGQLADAVLEAQLESPTLIIVGQVVSLSPYWRPEAEFAQPAEKDSVHQTMLSAR